MQNYQKTEQKQNINTSKHFHVFIEMNGKRKNNGMELVTVFSTDQAKFYVSNMKHISQFAFRAKKKYSYNQKCIWLITRNGHQNDYKCPLVQKKWWIVIEVFNSII